jgi:chromosome segregation ATPase
MSEDATQQLLMARVDRLISIVEPISGKLDNLEKQVTERLDNLEKRFDNLESRFDNLESRFDNLESRFDNIESRFDNLESRFDNLESRFDNLENQQSALSASLESLETKVDQRLRETRPIWENVLSQITELKKEIDELRAETASGFRAGDRKIGVLSKNLVDMTAEIQELRELIEKLESQPA